MFNWNVDEERFKKEDPEGYRLWRLTQLINYGLEGEKLDREEIYAAFLSEDVHNAFLHGHSYTANPIGCAAALASLDLFEKEHTLARVAEIERLYRGRFQGLAAKSNVERTRTLGSIAAFEVKTDSSGYGAAVGATLKAMLMEQGLLLRPLGNVVYLIPPYCIADQELHHAFDVLDDALERVR